MHIFCLHYLNVGMNATVVKYKFEFYWRNLWFPLFTITLLSWWMSKPPNHGKGQNFLTNGVAGWAERWGRFLRYHHHQAMDWLVCCRARWSSFWEILTVPRWGIALVCNYIFRKRRRAQIRVYMCCSRSYFCAVVIYGFATFSMLTSVNEFSTAGKPPLAA